MTKTIRYVAEKTLTIVLISLLIIAIAAIAVASKLDAGTLGLASEQTAKESPKQASFENSITDKLSPQEKTELPEFSSKSLLERLKLAVEKNKKRGGR